MDNTIKLEQLKTTIEKLSKDHQLEMLKILNSCPDIKLNENKSGVYVNLSFLPETTIKKLLVYLEYIQDQEKMLLLTESKKEHYVKAYFEGEPETNDTTVASITN
jgi:hypothetical protein